MANVKISALSDGGNIVSTDDIPLVRAGSTLRGQLPQDLASTDSPSFTGLTIDTSVLVVDDTNDRVGIGTASPDNLCHIFDSSAGTFTPNASANTLLLEATSIVGMTLATSNSGVATIYFGDTHSNSAAGVQYAHSTNLMTFTANTTAVLTQDPTDTVIQGGVFRVNRTDGNVGIGALPVTGITTLIGNDAVLRLANADDSTSYTQFDDSADGLFLLDKHTASGQATMSIDAYADDNVSAAQIAFWRFSDTTGHKKFTMYRGNASSTVDHEISVDDNDTFFYTNLLFLDQSNSRVGINDATPSYALDVTGDINSTTEYRVGGTSVLSGTTLGSGVVNSSLTTLGTLTALTINSATVTLSQDTNFVISGGVNGFSIDGTTFSVDGTNNRVGIGTSAPTAALDVVGSIEMTATAPQLFINCAAGGSGNAGILYLDSGSSFRNALTFPGGNLTVLANRGANGTVEIRANSASAGGGGEVTAAIFEDTQVAVQAIDFVVDTNTLFVDASEDEVGINTTSPAAALHVDQPSATGATPVITMDQGDVSEPFIDFLGTSAASAANSLSSWTTGNSVQGHIQVDINGTKRWLRFYDDPTS